MNYTTLRKEGEFALEVMGARKNGRARERHARQGNSHVISSKLTLSLPFRAPPTHALATKLETFNFFYVIQNK